MSLQLLPTLASQALPRVIEPWAVSLLAYFERQLWQ